MFIFRAWVSGYFPFYYHMGFDVLMIILYTTTCKTLYVTLKSFSEEHFNWCKAWIVSITLMMIFSYLIWLGVEVYFALREKIDDERKELKTDELLLYIAVIMTAEYFPVMSYVSFLMLRKDRLRTSVLVPSVWIWDIRDE